MTHPASGNPTWKDYPDLSTPVTAASLEAIEGTLDALDAAGSPVEAGSLVSVLNSGDISLVQASPSAFDHAFTTTRTGKITLRQNIQFAPRQNQGTANSFRPAPCLAGIELVRASDSVVLTSDRNWNEVVTFDTGLGSYGLSNVTTELLSGVLPAGNYLARAVVFAVQYGGGPRAYVQRLKTFWQVVG